jgi:hypothetical protein
LGHTRSEIDPQRLGERQWLRLRRVVRQAILVDTRGGAEQNSNQRSRKRTVRSSRSSMVFVTSGISTSRVVSGLRSRRRWMSEPRLCMSPSESLRLASLDLRAKPALLLLGADETCDQLNTAGRAYGRQLGLLPQR